MKHLVGLAVAASLAVSGTAQPHHHGHHNHARHQPAQDIEKRTLVTETVTETVTKYIMAGGGEISEEEAEACLAAGTCQVVGNSKSEVATNSNAASAGVFKEEDDDDEDENEDETTSSSTTSSSTTSSTSSISSSTSSSASTSASSSSNSVSANSMTTYTYVDAEFPSGTIPCSEFPSAYGAVAADWLDLGGWLGLQYGTSDIVTGVAGDSCEEGWYCSYLCPEGYQKSQWPETQGSSGESIGGLYCNSDGYLELTRSSVSTLCQHGKGGVYVSSSLSETVYVCRTDYPGTESMLIPIEVAGDGVEHEVTNPDQTWFEWLGQKTTAQYYVNPAGLSRDDACTWDSTAAPDSAGDKAPTNFGTGMDGSTTYFGLFPNSAVSSAVLDYNIKVSVDGVETCSLVDGVYSGGSSGCTGAATDGAKILIELY